MRSRLAAWWGQPASRIYVGLYALALVVRTLLAWPVVGPSYFDAAYYQNAAASLAAGHGLIDQVIWHYLDDPACRGRATSTGRRSTPGWPLWACWSTAGAGCRRSILP